MNIQTSRGNFNVTARFIDTVLGFPFDNKDKNYHDQYRIMVSKDKKRASFDYYMSASDTQKGNKFEDYKLALYCLFQDGYDGSFSFEDFCSNMGYDQDSRNAEKIYKACQKMLEKCYRFLDTTDQMLDIIDELSD
jgi:hypothetical protein